MIDNSSSSSSSSLVNTPHLIHYTQNFFLKSSHLILSDWSKRHVSQNIFIFGLSPAQTQPMLVSLVWLGCEYVWADVSVTVQKTWRGHDVQRTNSTSQLLNTQHKHTQWKYARTCPALSSHPLSHFLLHQQTWWRQTKHHHYARIDSLHLHVHRWMTSTRVQFKQLMDLNNHNIQNSETNVAEVSSLTLKLNNLWTPMMLMLKLVCCFTVTALFYLDIIGQF